MGPKGVSASQPTVSGPNSAMSRSWTCREELLQRAFAGDGLVDLAGILFGRQLGRDDLRVPDPVHLDLEALGRHPVDRDARRVDGVGS